MCSLIKRQHYEKNIPVYNSVNHFLFQKGYWLLKIENNKPSAYFLGLSFSHYYFNKVQEQPIINGDYLQIEGSLVKIVKVVGLPGYDDYSAMEDRKLFKIKLKDLMLDSDQDGYNDIFEKSFV